LAASIKIKSASTFSLVIHFLEIYPTDVSTYMRNDVFKLIHFCTLYNGKKLGKKSQVPLSLHQLQQSLLSSLWIFANLIDENVSFVSLMNYF